MGASETGNHTASSRAGNERELKQEEDHHPRHGHRGRKNSYFKETGTDSQALKQGNRVQEPVNCRVSCRMPEKELT